MAKTGDLREALAALQKGDWQAAHAIVQADEDSRFVTFEGCVTHQAMKAEEVWRSPWLDGNEEQA